LRNLDPELDLFFGLCAVVAGSRGRGGERDADND
jgi:hypothetical protein